VKSILLCFCLLGTTAFALDSNELSAIAFGLRALKMSPSDLAFKKDMAESEFVLQKARRFLYQPLELAEYGDQTREELGNCDSLQQLVAFAQQELEVKSGVRSMGLTNLRACLESREATALNGRPACSRCRGHNGTGETPVQLGVSKHALRPDVPAGVTAVVENIYNAALAVPVPPKNAHTAFTAFAMDSFRLDKDAGELDAWDKIGMDTKAIRELLRRDENLELQDDELGMMFLNAADGFDLTNCLAASWRLARAVDAAVAGLQTNKFEGEFQIKRDTELGKVIIGGVGRNVYTNEAFLIIDLGGDDIYLNAAGGANGLVGRPVSVVIDLAGNDQFISQKSFSQGAGVFGVGILAALGSNCTFQAKHMSQGAGFFGCGLLMTGPGRQTFDAMTFCQGAGFFGAGILWQCGGNSTYRANQLAQGFGGVQGVGLVLDTGGNDTYVAGGKEECPWIPGHYFTLAQGMGFGMRPFAGGGVGVLCDLKGDDRYVADVYGHGVSYWYAVGMLLDAEGNDVYSAYQYCQGAGIHLSSGLLMDWVGNDQYTARGLCQGTAHDYSVGLLVDRSGNDRYIGDSATQGGAINNSFALLLDREGDDFYAAHDVNSSQGCGHDGLKREYGSIALLLDLAGKDTYSQGQTNNAMWLKPLYGAGLDAEWKGGGKGEWVTGRVGKTTPATRKKWPPVDPHHPVERLLRRATRDVEKEVNRKDAEVAWEEMKTQGTNALSYLVTRLDTPNVWLRAKTEELVDYLGTNSVPVLVAGMAGARNDEVARVCCFFLARFPTATNAIPHVLPLLNRKDTRVTALYTLGHLRAREVYEPAIAGLTDTNELVRLRSAQALGRLRDPRAIKNLIAALNDELWDIRYAASDALVAMGKPAIVPLRAAYSKATPRARAHIIEALAKLGDPRSETLARQYYRQDEPLLRDAVLKQQSRYPNR
jgi:hypothetical protein